MWSDSSLSLPVRDFSSTSLTCLERCLAPSSTMTHKTSAASPLAKLYPRELVLPIYVHLACLLLLSRVLCLPPALPSQEEAPALTAWSLVPRLPGMA